MTDLDSSIVAEVGGIIMTAGLLPLSLLRDGDGRARKCASFCLREVDRCEEVEGELVLIDSIVGCGLSGRRRLVASLCSPTEVSVAICSLSPFVVPVFGRPESCRPFG